MDQGEITLGSSLPPFREDELSGRVLLFPDQPHGSSLPPPPTHPISWQCAQRGEARAVRHARRVATPMRVMLSSFGQVGVFLHSDTAHAQSARLRDARMGSELRARRPTRACVPSSARCLGMFRRCSR